VIVLSTPSQTPPTCESVCEKLTVRPPGSLMLERLPWVSRGMVVLPPSYAVTPLRTALEYE
jgi:hypothetical protein